MRLSKIQIEHMAFVIIRDLLKQEKIIAEKKDSTIDEIMDLITEEFQKEDKLDQEVREILSDHMEKIRKENIEYQTILKDKIIVDTKRLFSINDFPTAKYLTIGLGLLSNS